MRQSSKILPDDFDDEEVGKVGQTRFSRQSDNQKSDRKNKSKSKEK